MRWMGSRARIMFCIAALTLAAASPGKAVACPNCKEALAAQPEDAARMARGYNWSILLMIGVPFSMLGVGAVAVRRAVKLGVLPDM